jgi:hypothetical protein
MRMRKEVDDFAQAASTARTREEWRELCSGPLSQRIQDGGDKDDLSMFGDILEMFHLRFPLTEEERKKVREQGEKLGLTREVYPFKRTVPQEDAPKSAPSRPGLRTLPKILWRKVGEKRRRQGKRIAPSVGMSEFPATLVIGDGSHDFVEAAAATIGADPARYQHLKGKTLEELQDIIAEYDAQRAYDNAMSPDEPDQPGGK